MDDAKTHSLTEDAQGIIYGATMAAFGIVILTHLGLVTGQTAGLAVLVSYATGWSFGPVFFAINLPFYLLGYLRMGPAFTAKTTQPAADADVDEPAPVAAAIASETYDEDTDTPDLDELEALQLMDQFSSDAMADEEEAAGEFDGAADDLSARLDAFDDDAFFPSGRNVNVGRLFVVQAAAHADIAYVGAGREDGGADFRAPTHQNAVGVADAADDLGLARRVVAVHFRR